MRSTRQHSPEKVFRSTNRKAPSISGNDEPAEIEEEIVIPSHKRKKRTGKKEEDLSNFEVTETIEYKLTGEDRYCPD